MVDQEMLQAIREIIKEETRTAVREETAPLHEEIQVLKTEVQEIKTDLLEVKADVLEVKATQEIKVLPGLSLLAEGHENIVEHIQEKIDARADKLQDAIDVLNVVVKYHSQDINELKIAQ